MPDHVHDIADAWDQIELSPWMGIGVGTAYSTWHIRRWKAESVMVHNAPLHVWLKYRLAGLLCYLWFHIAMLRWLYSKTRIGDRLSALSCEAAFAYLLAQFLMTLGFAPWPYSELQLTVLMSALLRGFRGSEPSRPLHKLSQLPKLSVITPSYNTGAFIEDAILSVSQQEGVDAGAHRNRRRVDGWHRRYHQAAQSVLDLRA